MHPFVRSTREKQVRVVREGSVQCVAGCSSAKVWYVFGAQSQEGKTTNSKGPNTEVCRTPGCDVEYLSWTDYHQREED